MLGMLGDAVKRVSCCVFCRLINIPNDFEISVENILDSAQFFVTQCRENMTEREILASFVREVLRGGHADSVEEQSVMKRWADLLQLFKKTRSPQRTRTIGNSLHICPAFVHVRMR